MKTFTILFVIAFVAVLVDGQSQDETKGAGIGSQGVSWLAKLQNPTDNSPEPSSKQPAKPKFSLLGGIGEVIHEVIHVLLGKGKGIDGVKGEVKDKVKGEVKGKGIDGEKGEVKGEGESAGEDKGKDGEKSKRKDGVKREVKGEGVGEDKGKGKEQGKGGEKGVEKVEGEEHKEDSGAEGVKNPAEGTKEEGSQGDNEQ